MAFLLEGSSTIKRSAGDRPVLLPVIDRNAPVSVRCPSPFLRANSISSAEHKSLNMVTEEFSIDVISVGPVEEF